MSKDTEKEHTPAPWKFIKSPMFGNKLRICPVDAYGGLRSDGPIADVFYSDEANARIIAAAPELLDALKELDAAIRHGRYEDPTHDRIHQALIKAKATIEKAEG